MPLSTEPNESDEITYHLLKGEDRFADADFLPVDFSPCHRLWQILRSRAEVFHRFKKVIKYTTIGQNHQMGYMRKKYFGILCFYFEKKGVGFM
ncbi:hypothetical protein DENIS_0520 [Desulfonema ishimotonii]|uniref:Uncharacterized protein n=1 Tax=Desulfonema ishimotonii TaxID=45657 RepID=A0A401FRJ3_9BACT|nr:hypothetical protein DENIS_0520 [Desulfonema ishimotonii]